MNKAIINGVEYDVAIDESNGKDMTAKVYYRIADGVIHISMIEFEEPIKDMEREKFVKGLCEIMMGSIKGLPLLTEHIGVGDKKSLQ